MNKTVAYPHTVRDILQEYFDKVDNIQNVIDNYNEVHKQTNQAVIVMGQGYHSSFIQPQYLRKDKALHLLKQSTYQGIYNILNFDKIFSANDKKKFQVLLENPPEITQENLEGVFGDYWANPRYYILKGLAEVFCDLDPFFKSHSNFGFGVKGLPKRIILRNFVRSYSDGSSTKLIDMCTAMLQLKPDLWLGELRLSEEPEKDYRQYIRNQAWNNRNGSFKLEQFGIEVKTFLNGNAHIHFNEKALNVVNEGLHEFYGDILPDESSPKPNKQKSSTEVSKDLQFYRTPKNVCEIVLRNMPYSNKDIKILEPSCGDGALLDALRERGFKNLFGVEYNSERAKISRDKGYNVFKGNFLEMVPSEDYDLILMNPPFYGEHYLKHIEKALEFLKERGTLICILPSAAYYKHGKLPKGFWRDLPIGSFKESGTNVNTGYYIITKEVKNA